MCQYSAVDGCMTDWHLIHLGHLALSGAALLTIEATAVLPEGRITYADVGLWNDETETAMARTLESVRRWSDMPIAIQLAHAGRKASTEVPWKGGAQIPPGVEHGWQTVAPSALPFAGAREPAGRARSRGDGRDPRGIRRRGEARGAGWASTRSSSTARTAICSISSSRRCRTGARTNMAAAWRTACASRWKYSMRSAPPSRPSGR